MAAELGQQTVDFSTLINRAAEDSFISLKELVENCKSPDQSDTDKKISLLKYILKTQQRMLRLNVVAKWCQQVPLIHYCQQLESTLSSHETCFTQAADSLFFMHEGLQQARAPVYDVPSAIEVLLTGSYHRLPKCIEDVGMQSTLGEDQKKPALKKLDTLLRSKLLEVSLPKEISEVKVSEGTALLRVDREFRVLVTLGYRGHLSLWRILHMELLVGGKSGMIKLEEFRRHALGDDLERRMAASENPFSILYSIIHELCVSLTMDTVIRQVQALRQGRWRDAIRFELISDASVGHGGSAGTTQVNQDGEVDTSSLRIPGVKIIYWMDSDKNSSHPDTGSYPFIKIELGPDLQIKCLHSTFVIDPLTGKEADFMLDQSCIDVERLLLRAICCNRYTRLLEIQRDLAKNAQIFRGAGDVLLEFHMEEADVASEKKVNSREHEGQEVLRVRAYGSSFFTLGINIRTGHFLLQSSQNIIEPSAVSECEDALNQGSMNAAEVFTSLRNKSIVHLFASIGKFLGLEVYEHGFPAVKLPNDISNDSAMLIMGFPDCGSSYLLIMQLDKDFKPLFKLLETQPEGPGKAHSFNDFNNVIHIKKIDIDQMQMLEDEMNMSLLDWEKLRSLFQRAGGPNHSSENSFLSDISLGSSMQIAGWPPSSFSSVVDEVFEVEAGSSFLPSSIHNNVSSSSSSHYMSFPLTLHAMKAGTPSPKWEERLQISQVNNSAKLPSSASHYNGSFPSSNLKGQAQSNSFGSLSSVSGRSTSARELSASKSDQDLSSLRSPQSAEFSSCTSVDEDQLRPLNDTQKDAMYGRAARLLSPPQCAGPQISGFNVKPNGFRSSPTGFLLGPFRVSGPTSVLQTLDSTLCHSPSHELVSEHEKNPRKRMVSDMFNLIPSLQGVEANSVSCKRRKVLDSSIAPPSSRILVVPKTDRFSYGYLIGESNKGNAPSSVYVSALLHVVRHCSLSIKHARLTSQMDDLDIPYVEEVGLRSVSSNIWFRLPLARGDTWQHICLRLGRPGSMYWDVKIRDQHFRDLWELQKGSNSTPWGSGVCIANTFDMDSHIRYDPEGVVLCYKSVEENSIKRLVADIQRLSNARLFSLGMIKLLGVRADEKLEESCTSPDGKALAGVKNSTETADRSSEQMRRAFRIEAVGLMSLRFSFGSGVVVARFVVEWESGKEGCTMHVSPDQLWPHTKFLEDFINGAEVASLLDCIRLTAGPLHALVAATRPARAGPIPGVPGAAAAFSTLPKQIGYLSQGLLPSSLTTNVTQASFGPMGNSVGATAGNPLANNSFHGAAMLAAAARGGPGIVPSSLLPIDVSVVLRGPYWIRIIYRKNFAVDMRCFAGDQVWLQPAAPPKGGPSVGGSIPCPQFRPFIMEHVAQELHGLEPNFGGGQHTVMTNSNSQNPSSGSQVQATNGNRVNPPSTAAMSRMSNQVAGFNRMGNALPISSTVVSSGMPVRRAPGSAVPAHLRGELNTAIIGLGDDGGYGGGWVPLVALKKVLRGILKYLGVLWLFAQLPDILKEILGSLLKDNEGALLNLDQEQPALRFFVGGYVFAVSVHRVQLLLQVLSVKRFHHQQQQQQQQQNSNSVQEELTQLEISEICDYFSRRVASEPYDASRVASFITLLTLPIPVLREFLKLIAWKKGITQALGGDIAPAQRPRIELCLENHARSSIDEGSENSSVAKSNIHYNRLHNSVDCALTVVLDPAHIPHTNAAGGAAWLPYCVSVRLKYFFGENPKVSFLDMEGSHGGRACWSCLDDWEKCKQRVDQTVEVHGCVAGDVNQGRLKAVADSVQRTLNLCLQGLRDGGGLTAISGAA